MKVRLIGSGAIMKQACLVQYFTVSLSFKFSFSWSVVHRPKMPLTSWQNMVPYAVPHCCHFRMCTCNLEDLTAPDLVVPNLGVGVELWSATRLSAECKENAVGSDENKIAPCTFTIFHTLFQFLLIFEICWGYGELQRDAVASNRDPRVGGEERTNFTSTYEQLMKDEETLCCMKGLKHAHTHAAVYPGHHRHDLYNM